jgi:hypothetical protein
LKTKIKTNLRIFIVPLKIKTTISNPKAPLKIALNKLKSCKHNAGARTLRRATKREPPQQTNSARADQMAIVVAVKCMRLWPPADVNKRRGQRKKCAWGLARRVWGSRIEARGSEALPLNASSSSLGRRNIPLSRLRAFFLSHGIIPSPPLLLLLCCCWCWCWCCTQRVRRRTRPDPLSPPIEVAHPPVPCAHPPLRAHHPHFSNSNPQPLVSLYTRGYVANFTKHDANTN